MTTKQFTGFIIYNIIALPLLYLPPDKLHRPLRIAIVASTLSIFGLSIGLMAAAKDAGSYISTAASAKPGHDLAWAFIRGITTLSSAETPSA
jgi:NCS1 family nucleobase:cation symporter-1